MTPATSAMVQRINAIAVIAFGLLIIAGLVPELAAPMVLLTEGALWPQQAPPALTEPVTRLFLATTGGLTVGLGAALWLLATRLAPHQPALARGMASWIVVTWYLADSGACALAGAYGNVVLNTLFAAVLLAPMVLPSRHAA
ncbi:MAG: hypothetical protein EAZ99_02765 [Alphaproteobacteria bacterium]|nr:hypothetical protein [Alphaproteobacteria bacterium]TAD91586.1 MAG: hypothetical protein EAZ99_02765 [Alphaproteobacteria bacterium]